MLPGHVATRVHLLKPKRLYQIILKKRDPKKTSCDCMMSSLENSYPKLISVDGSRLSHLCCETPLQKYLLWGMLLTRSTSSVSRFLATQLLVSYDALKAGFSLFLTFRQTLALIEVALKIKNLTGILHTFFARSHCSSTAIRNLIDNEAETKVSERVRELPYRQYQRLT